MKHLTSSPLTDLVCDRDRRWFEAHPGETEYVRAYVPGEIAPDVIAACQLTHGPDLAPGALITVVQLAPGVRTRRLMVPDTEAIRAV